MGTRMLSCNSARPASPISCALGDAGLIEPGADGRADGHGLPHAQEHIDVDSDDLAAFSSFSITASRLGVDGAVSTPSITFSIIS